MRLKYRILWFEDATSFLNITKKRLSEFLDELGFDAVFEEEKDGSQLDKLLDNNLFDLILLDFNLEEESTNDNQLITKIREKDVYTEVIFYSAQRGFKAYVGEHLDGVFFTDRENLYEKAKNVITMTVKRSQDVTYLRGLVIAETIDIETKMDELLLTYFGVDSWKKEVFEKIVDPSFHALDMKKKLDILIKMCNTRISFLDKEKNSNNATEIEKLDAELSEFEQIKTELIKMEKEVIHVRNILAHAREKEGNNNILLSRLNKDPKDVVIDDSWCTDTRNCIRKQSNNLDKLSFIIKKNS